MFKLVATTSAAAVAALLWTAVLSDEAKADGWRHHRHHHHYRHHHHWRHPHQAWRWGDNDYAIIRWSWGDCKIWHDDNGPPAGTGWTVLADGLPTAGAAWGMLVRLQSRGRCL